VHTRPDEAPAITIITKCLKPYKRTATSFTACAATTVTKDLRNQGKHLDCLYFLETLHASIPYCLKHAKPTLY